MIDFKQEISSHFSVSGYLPRVDGDGTVAEMLVHGSGPRHVSVKSTVPVPFSPAKPSSRSVASAKLLLRAPLCGPLPARIKSVCKYQSCMFSKHTRQPLRSDHPAAAEAFTAVLLDSKMIL